MIGKFTLLAAISLCWAAGYIFIDDADGDIRPITATAGMTVVAAVFMLLVVPLVARRPLLQPLRTRPWVPLIMAFSAIVLPNLAVVEAERTVQPNLAALLGTTVPILTLFITTFVTRQIAFSPVHILGALVAVLGLVLFVGLQNLLDDGGELRGILVMMAGGLIFALSGIFASYETTGLDEYALTAWTITFGAIALTIAAFLVEDPLATTRSWDAVWPLVAEGILGMGLAYLGYYVLIARSGAYFASLYAFLVPPFGVVAAALAFGEALTLRHTAGLAVVLLGLALMIHRERTPAGIRKVEAGT